jgi:hypothetical protein
MDWAQNAPQSSVHTTRPHQFYKNNKCFYFNYLGKQTRLSAGERRGRGGGGEQTAAHIFLIKKNKKNGILDGQLTKK